MHHHQPIVTVAQLGVGPIGAEIARLILTKPWLRLVAAVDTDPGKAGRDLGEVIGLGRTAGIVVTDRLTVKAEVVCHSTGSRLASELPVLEKLLERGSHVISTCEELSYPVDQGIRESLQKTARSHGVTLLGTGVNPGFVMDKLPLTLTAACEQVHEIAIERVVDASTRRAPLQRKVGAGMTTREFAEAVAAGRIRHTGLKESLLMLANGLDLELATISEEIIEPVIAAADFDTGVLKVRKGEVAGVHQTISAGAANRTRLSLDLRMYVGAEKSRDTIVIKGLPDIKAVIEGGVHGDTATAAMVVNAIPRVLNAHPGLLSMDDIPVSFR
jgi:4-hydroxy-tetrahydrodipicolinate reductase